DALILALKACGVGPGDEVITVSHTFFATSEAILHAGATPVYVDIRSDSMLMDTSLLEKRITPKTKAIIPVHLYGQTVDMDEVMGVARKRGLKVIEDAAQAHGARYKGKMAGAMGDVGCFSFYFSKNLGAYGEGGFCSTNDPDIADRLEKLRNHGHRSKFEHALVGYNSRLDELQAVVLRSKLKRLAQGNESRRKNAETYNELIGAAAMKFPGKGADKKSFRLPIEISGNYHVYHCFALRVPRRNDLFDLLGKKEIGSGIHYKVPNHLQEAVRHLGYKKGDLPVTEQACDDVISLPMYPALKREQVVEVCDVVRSHLESCASGR
ncbi:MAG: DegT/DnrJ/EryC1/StrS family aminotransferase, partial [Planctomycetota bacterium]|nr:DegT/DnrJ/EryC1/StrS family aminotransferase [Planctomycetota bacterium]